MHASQSDFSLDSFVSFARTLARAARKETLTRFGSDLRIENKNDDGVFDPVTDADRGAEMAMRQLIEERFPEHGISGEEYPDRPASSPYAWSLDPVDGTRSFVCGLPTWVTLLALLKDGEPILGLIDAPCLDETYVGTIAGSLVERRGLSDSLITSRCTQMSRARLSTTDPYLFDDRAKEGFEKLRRATRTVRFGHDGYAYGRLAAGSLDLVIECGLKPHDYNALIPVVTGAGGAFGDWKGGRDFASGNVIAAATQTLYDEAAAIMRDAQ